MTRTPRPGDRVRATGVVVTLPDDADPSSATVEVQWDTSCGEDLATWPHQIRALEIEAPSEPPRGTAVLVDGVVWINTEDGIYPWYAPATDNITTWDKISSGTFTLLFHGGTITEEGT